MVTIAVIVCLVTTILNKVLKNKLKTSLTVYLPTILAILIRFFVKYFTIGVESALSLDTVYEGLIIGSLSTVISVIVSKIISGKPISSPRVLLLEGILGEFVNKEHVQSVTNEILLVIEDDGDDLAKTNKVSEIIFNYTNLEMNNEQIENLSIFIIKSVSGIKK
jgi:hypothetical protein